jgi:hypothetical protein
MNRTAAKRLLISGLVAASLAAPLLTAHHAQVRLRREDEALRRQAAESTLRFAESERLSNELAQAESRQTLTAEQRSELLRLRNEVTQLHSAAGVLQK